MQEKRKNRNKITLTAEQFDAKLERIINNDHPIDRWFPTMRDAREIAEEPVTNLDFIIWITESNDSLELDGEQQKVMDFLQDLLKETVEIKDGTAA